MEKAHIFYKAELHRVLDECRSIIAAYPPQLSQEGTSYLQKLNMLSDGSPGASAGILIPFWFMDPFGLERDLCHKLALGNCFALLYFMSQDEAYDEGRVELLPLGSLFLLDLIRQYRRVFDSDSPFWNHFDGYLRQWAESITWERSLKAAPVHSFGEPELLMLSRKAAPLKIPYAAVCLLSGNHARIPAYEALVDADQTAYQMIDDWRDWKEDLKDGRITLFLSNAMAFHHLDCMDKLTEKHVREAVFSGDVAEKLFCIALEYNKKALDYAGQIKVPYLESYLNKVGEKCREYLASVDADRQRLFGGGFGSLLTKLTHQGGERTL